MKHDKTPESVRYAQNENPSQTIRDSPDHARIRWTGNSGRVLGFHLDQGPSTCHDYTNLIGSSEILWLIGSLVDWFFGRLVSLVDWSQIPQDAIWELWESCLFLLNLCIITFFFNIVCCAFYLFKKLCVVHHFKSVCAFVCVITFPV